MSFRELRNFTEILRALGYPRLVSVDNFREPHFALVADILYWMTIRYEPNANISDDIDSEHHRVEFVTSVAALFATKAGIKLNCKRLYAADGRAVKELLKVANTLYSALRSNQAATADTADDASTSNFALSAKLADLKTTHALGAEITEMGAKLYDLLRQEQDLKDVRARALRHLDSMSASSSMGDGEVHNAVRRKLRTLLDAANDNVRGMEKQAHALESDQKALGIKIKKKSAELERSEKRLRSLQTVRPAHMDEYERLEGDLQRHYEIYLERFRNLDYLEHELDLYNRSEQEKVEEGERALKRLQTRIRDQERRILRGEDRDLDDSGFGRAGGSGSGGDGGGGGPARPTAAAARREGRLADGRGRARGSMAPSSSDESDFSGLDSSLSDTGSSHVSMGDDHGSLGSLSGSDDDLDRSDHSDRSF